MDPSGLLTNGDIVQGGGIAVALALVAVIVWQTRLLMTLVSTFDSRMKQTTEGCETRLGKLVEHSNAVIERNAEAMDRHNEALARLTGALERR